MCCYIFISERLSFGVGRLVGSPATRSPSPSHSPCPDSPPSDRRDAEVDVDVEEEEVDVDVEEVGDEDDRDAMSSPPRSSTTPSPTSVAISPTSNPPKKSGDTFSVSALLRPDPPSAHLQNASPHRDTTSIGAHPPPPGSSILYPPLHLQGGLLPPHPHHPLSYLHPQLLPHHLLPPHLHPLLRGVHPGHPGLHSTHTAHGLHHHPLGDVYSCVKCDKMFSTPHGLEVGLIGWEELPGGSNFLMYRIKSRKDELLVSRIEFAWLF